MILASGARVPGFNSRSSPLLSKLMPLAAMVLAAAQAVSQNTQEQAHRCNCKQRIMFDCCPVHNVAGVPSKPFRHRTMIPLCEHRRKSEMQTYLPCIELVLQSCVMNHRTARGTQSYETPFMVACPRSCNRACATTRKAETRHKIPSAPFDMVEPQNNHRHFARVV